jgi:UDP-N-acetylenolpyruvoylglucosamine reductase
MMTEASRVIAASRLRRVQGDDVTVSSYQANFLLADRA